MDSNTSSCCFANSTFDFLIFLCFFFFKSNKLYSNKKMNYLTELVLIDLETFKKSLLTYFLTSLSCYVFSALPL